MINDRLCTITAQVLSARKDKHGWDKGLFADILLLSADERGEVGERLIESLLSDAGVEGVTRSGALDRTQKHWDIRTADIDIEVKTATLGRNVSTFQHESIEKDRNYHVIVMVDIAPNAVYITWTAKQSMPFKKMHRRANSNAYKWDFKLADVQQNVVHTSADILNGYNKVVNEVNSKK